MHSRALVSTLLCSRKPDDLALLADGPGSASRLLLTRVVSRSAAKDRRAQPRRFSPFCDCHKPPSPPFRLFFCRPLRQPGPRSDLACLPLGQSARAVAQPGPRPTSSPPSPTQRARSKAKGSLSPPPPSLNELESPPIPALPPSLRPIHPAACPVSSLELRPRTRAFGLSAKGSRSSQPAQGSRSLGRLFVDPCLSASSPGPPPGKSRLTPLIPLA